MSSLPSWAILPCWQGQNLLPGTALASGLVAPCKVTEKARPPSSKAHLPHSHADFMWLLADGRDAAVAHAGLLVVTSGQSHVAKLAQL